MKLDLIFSNILSEIEKIQSIPAPTFQEKNRSDYMFAEFSKRGLISVEKDSIGNVLGFLPGGPEKPIVISAHLDTVHDQQIKYEISKNLSCWRGAGVGDNTTSLAVLLSLIDYFEEENDCLKGGIWFVANVGEEGLGNMIGMRKVVDHFQDQVHAYIVLEGIGLGIIYHRALGVKRYQLSVMTHGGHAWGDNGKKSAISELVILIHRLVKMEIPKFPKSSLNIGTISGGGSINSIAKRAYCQFEFRSSDENVLCKMDAKIKDLLFEGKSQDVEIELELIGDRPFGMISEEHPLVKCAVNALKQIGIEPILAIGSTDASYPLSRGYPSICVCITYGGDVHTENEYIDINNIPKGFLQVKNILEHIWD